MPGACGREEREYALLPRAGIRLYVLSTSSISPGFMNGL